MRSVLQRLRFEPAIITGLVVAAAAFVGVELADDDAAATVNSAFQIGVVVVPLLQGLVTRLRTRSVASLEAEGYSGPT